jgi:hypothetical protein
VVFYEPKADYAGPDHVNYEITSATGAVETYDVTINVKPAPAAGVPNGEIGTRL